MRDDLINNHTCININSDSLIIMGGIYFEIYFPYFVMEIKHFCTSKTMSSIVVPITGHYFRPEHCNSNSEVRVEAS